MISPDDAGERRSIKCVHHLRRAEAGRLNDGHQRSLGIGSRYPPDRPSSVLLEPKFPVFSLFCREFLKLEPKEGFAPNWAHHQSYRKIRRSVEPRLGQGFCARCGAWPWGKGGKKAATHAMRGR